MGFLGGGFEVFLNFWILFWAVYVFLLGVLVLLKGQDGGYFSMTFLRLFGGVYWRFFRSFKGFFAFVCFFKYMNNHQQTTMDFRFGSFECR